MISLERTTDQAIIRAIATDPRIWDQMSDDHSPKREDYEPPMDGAVYVLVKEDDVPRGFWALVPKSKIRFEIHTCLLPEFRGFRALDAAARMAEWVWQNTPCERLYTEVPLCNARALWFAKAARMVESGREPAAFLKNGALHDLVILGMNRPKGVEA